MTGELVPFGCDLPMWHEIDAFSQGENHQWTVIGPYGAMVLTAACISLGPELDDVYPRDGNGAHWLANGLVFHGVALLGCDHYYFPLCHVLKGECYSLVLSAMQTFKVVELAILYARDRDTYIHRMLTAEYYLSVARGLLDVDPVGVLAW